MCHQKVSSWQEWINMQLWQNRWVGRWRNCLPSTPEKAEYASFILKKQPEQLPFPTVVLHTHYYLQYRTHSLSVFLVLSPSFDLWYGGSLVFPLNLMILCCCNRQPQRLIWTRALNNLVLGRLHLCACSYAKWSVCVGAGLFFIHPDATRSPPASIICFSLSLVTWEDGLKLCVWECDCTWAHLNCEMENTACMMHCMCAKLKGKSSVWWCIFITPIVFALWGEMSIVSLYEYVCLCRLSVCLY